MLRLVLSPRWIAWHLLTLGAMTTCAFLAVWQWHRAGSAMGSALNVGYGLQWPLFAVFFAFFWWHFLHLEVRSLRSRAQRDGSADGPAAAPVVVDEERDPVQPGAAEPGSHEDRPSPFGPRPAGIEFSRLSDPQLRAYNDELAKLSARDQEH